MGDGEFEYLTSLSKIFMVLKIGIKELEKGLFLDFLPIFPVLPVQFLVHPIELVNSI